MFAPPLPLMTDAPDEEFAEWRVLICAPSGHDARLSAEFIAAAGLRAEVTGSIAALNACAREGCGAILLAEEALTESATAELFRWLKLQPAWSDIPIALITSSGAASEERLRRLAAFRAEGNVTLLERPFRPGTLISALEVALRSRRRQYEVRRLLAQLGAARDTAERASRAKDEFLAALSHELRTPLSPVLLLATEAADNPVLPRAIRDDFAMIVRNIGLEARLIDDLLDLTRITRGKLSLDLQAVDAHQVLCEAIVTTQAELDDKGLQLETDLRARHSQVWGDPVRLQQVFWNVLKNAAKFTPPAGSVRVETFNDALSGDLMIRFTDSGVGMTQEELTRVFEAFAQGDHATAAHQHRFGGLGLGLAISRMLMELHGGKILAESRGRGQGSVFVVRLKTEAIAHPPGQGPAVAVPAAKPALAGKARRHVLLVEDHGPTRTTLEKLLQRRGYEVRTAGSLAEARALAREQRVELLLSDLGLPDGNGCELMEELRGREGLRAIALSGYGMDADIAQSRRAGFDAHLIKPVSVRALEAALGQLEAGG